MAADSKILFEKDGVFIHTTIASADEDALVAGKIFLIQKPEGVFVEWKAVDDSTCESENEWAVVDTVAYNKGDNKDGTNSNAGKQKLATVLGTPVDGTKLSSKPPDGKAVQLGKDKPPCSTLVEKPSTQGMPATSTSDPTDKQKTLPKNMKDCPQKMLQHQGLIRERGVVAMSKVPKVKSNAHMYIVNFDVLDLKSFKRSKPNLGWSYLIFILKCGTTCPALHFHHGGTKAFMRAIEHYLNVKRSPVDSCLYLVREHDPTALSRSFDELQLFEEQANDILTKPGFFAKKFIRDPYTTTLGGFSKVTNFLRESLMTHEQDRPCDDVIASIPEEIEGININNSEEPGFEMIMTVDLPERPTVTRSGPLDPQQWSHHMDQKGKVMDIDKLKEHIFRGGVDPTIRIEVWKFLLDYYSWDSTYKMRTEQRKKKVDDYFRMKLQWKSVTADQERRFSWIKDRKSLIDKDVTRTDRTHQFFQGEDNPNLQVLYDILMTYCMYNFDLGYVQGMSDLLAPILVVLENEVDAFWCFAGFMERVHDNFEMTQEGMKTQLQQTHTLVKFLDPQLCNYLESHDSSNMYFCFRWLLIMFKREFSFPDIMRLWEVMWTDLPCKNWHLIICVAMLDSEKMLLMENNFGFTEILKHINDMSGTLEVDEVLKTAEAISLQLKECRNLPSAIRDIIDVSGDRSPACCSLGSGASTPDHDLPSGRPMANGGRAGAGPDHDALSESGTAVTTPDDSSSIEILHPDHMDMGGL